VKFQSCGGGRYSGIVTASFNLIAIISANIQAIQSGSGAVVSSNSSTANSTTTTNSTTSNSTSSGAGSAASAVSLIDTCAWVYQDSSVGIAYLMVSILALFYGQPVSAPPYSDLGIPALPANTSGSGVPQSVQVKAAITYINVTINFLNLTGQQFEDLQGPVATDCGCPNTTSVAPLIAEWTAIMTALQGLANRTTSGNATASSNSTTASNSTTTTNSTSSSNSTTIAGSIDVAANLTAALQGLQLLLLQESTCAPCLAAHAKQSGVRDFTPCKDSKNRSACAASGSRKIKRKARLEKMRARCRRAVGNRMKGSMKKRVRSRAKKFSKAVKSGVRRFRKNVRYVYIPPVMTSLNAYATLMASLSDSISYQSQSALNSTDSACNATGNSTDTAVITATTNVTDMFVNFTAMVINNTVAYPNCTQYADLALSMISQINDQIIACGNQSDTAQSSIYANVTINIVAMAEEYNNFASKSDKCTRSFANSWLWMYIKWVMYRMGITSGIPNFLACQTQVCN